MALSQSALSELLDAFRAGTKPVTTYCIRAKRWVKPPLPTRPFWEYGHLSGNPVRARAR